VHVQGTSREATRVHHQSLGNRGQPEENRSHPKDGTSMITKEGPEAYWLHGNTDSLHLTAWLERLAILQTAQECG
jgi:hypothetical protein